MKTFGLFLFALVVIAGCKPANPTLVLHAQEINPNLKVGKPIKMYNQPIGHIKSITLNEDATLYLVAELTEGIGVPKGSVFRMSIIDLFGDCEIEVLPANTSAIYLPGDTISVDWKAHDVDIDSIQDMMHQIYDILRDSTRP